MSVVRENKEQESEDNSASDTQVVSNRNESGASQSGNNQGTIELVKPDVLALMGEIRSRIKADLERNRDKQPTFNSFNANADNRAGFKAGALLRSTELSYLNHNFQYSFRSRGAPFTSQRGGIIGKVIVKIKQKFIALREYILRDYIEAEKEFQAHLVRHLNEIAQYVDARDGACFWELIHKIDYDVTRALERIERIADENSASLRSSERRMYDEIDSALKDIRRSVEILQATNAQQDAKLAELNSVSHGLEAILANLPQKDPSSLDYSGDKIGDNQSHEVTPSFPNYSYLLLENRFRGSEQDIAARLSIYPPLFLNSKSPILEIGGGRGELQILMSKAGINSYSVDIDQAMVQAGLARGVDARLDDGLAHLRALADHSLGGLIAIQVVEHLTRTQLEELMSLARQKVIIGGKIIFETINPQSVLALSSNYFRDLTHVFPLHPDTLSYVMELSKLKVHEIRMLSPVPKEAQLKTLKVEEYMTPRWAFTIETLNGNLERLNRLLYGFQDYCIIAEVV